MVFRRVDSQRRNPNKDLSNDCQKFSDLLKSQRKIRKEKTTKMKNLNERAKNIHQRHIKWWQNIETGERIERNKSELLMLIISEISEAMEGERKDLMDDKLPHRKMAEVEMADAAIRIFDFCGGLNISLEEKEIEVKQVDNTPNKGELLFLICYVISSSYDVIQLADSEQYLVMSFCMSTALAMISGYCEKFSYDLEGAIAEKLAFNAIRKDHTHEQRKLADGKKF